MQGKVVAPAEDSLWVVPSGGPTSNQDQHDESSYSMKNQLVWQFLRTPWLSSAVPELPPLRQKSGMCVLDAGASPLAPKPQSPLGPTASVCGSPRQTILATKVLTPRACENAPQLGAPNANYSDVVTLVEACRTAACPRDDVDELLVRPLGPRLACRYIYVFIIEFYFLAPAFDGVVGTPTASDSPGS